MTPASLEPAIPASERLQAHVLDRTANEIGLANLHRLAYHRKKNNTY
jgi:hypothetical protein